MAVFEFPTGLDELAHFSVKRVQTWGSSYDRQYKESIRIAANLPAEISNHYVWFVFVVRCVVAQSRGRVANQIPDVENIPKLIVDAFIGVLYPDDHLHYVRGVQVEAVFGPDNQETAEVWIFGKPREM